jgi:DNA-binding NtrC family response regulator
MADIILVEDDATIGRSYAEALRMSDHDVRLAESAEVLETELQKAVPTSSSSTSACRGSMGSIFCGGSASTPGKPS